MADCCSESQGRILQLPIGNCMAQAVLCPLRLVPHFLSVGMVLTASLIESARGESVKTPVTREPPSKKALYGLYSVYLAIGIVYGFFAASIYGPLICHYYFGPFGQPDGTSAAQCVLGVSLFNFPWSLKVFIALLVDNFKVLGSRKRWRRRTSLSTSTAAT